MPEMQALLDRHGQRMKHLTTQPAQPHSPSTTYSASFTMQTTWQVRCRSWCVSSHTWADEGVQEHDQSIPRPLPLPPIQRKSDPTITAEPTPHPAVTSSRPPLPPISHVAPGHDPPVDTDHTIHPAVSSSRPPLPPIDHGARAGPSDHPDMPRPPAFSSRSTNPVLPFEYVRVLHQW